MMTCLGSLTLPLSFFECKCARCIPLCSPYILDVPFDSPLRSTGARRATTLLGIY